MLTARLPALPPRSLVTVDKDEELALLKLHNVLIAHWRGPSDERNGHRLAKALRELAQAGPVGYVELVEPSPAAPSKAQRVFLTRMVSELPVEAVVNVVRGNALRRSFATVILTGMLFLVPDELSSKIAVCTNEGAAAAWISNHMTKPPRREELTHALEFLRV